MDALLSAGRNKSAEERKAMLSRAKEKDVRTLSDFLKLHKAMKAAAPEDRMKLLREAPREAAAEVFRYCSFNFTGDLLACAQADLGCTGPVSIVGDKIVAKSFAQQ